MKILYVDYYHEYGNPSRGLNYIGIEGFERGLSNLGHDVHHFYFDNYLEDRDGLAKALLECFHSVKPELVFFNLYNDIVDIETIKIISSSAISLNWFGDDPFLFERFTKHYAPHFTYCVTTDKYSINKYLSIGQRNVIYSQWPAHQFNQTKFDQLNYKYDVSFVGAKNPPREWFVNELRIRGIEVEVFGNGWPKGPITNEEMCAVFAQSKINLNISNSDEWDFRFLFSRYCSPNVLIKTLLLYYINRYEITRKIFSLIRKKHISTITFYGKTSSQIKARNFEIPCCGGFQLTNYVPSIEDYFILGEEVSCYSTIEDAAKLIQYYLLEDAERERIKIAGYERSNSEYTYEKRLEKILETIT